MNSTKKSIVCIGLVTVTCLGTLCAQDEYDEYSEPTKVNTSLGLIVTAPLSPTSRVANIGWGAVVGAGYNFSRRHAAIGELMWNRLYPTDEALRPINATLQTPVNGNTDLFAVTGNYRLEFRGNKFGTYFIGGGGWYFRHSNLSERVASGVSTTCTPAWQWWGFTCSAGIVNSNQTIASSSSSALGGNAGIGFTVKTAEPSYRFYVESRYHYAPNKSLHTQLITITVGIRY